jgi:hypothetical protein
VYIRSPALWAVICLATACSGTDSTATGPTADATVNTIADGPMDAAVEIPEGCLNFGTSGATAACVKPNRPGAYYVAEALAYFDTLDVDAPRENVPNYHALVARWEWPPWLLLTGYTSEDMILSSDLLRQIDPSTVPERDCRFFEKQPFARCYIAFEYERGRCPIYEEFSFNEEGQMTFIEAWSDIPGLLPNAPDDPWAEADNFPRLATRVPGLGNGTGTLDLESEYMIGAAMTDTDLATFALRATDWRRYWFAELNEAQADFFGVGCGWPPLMKDPKKPPTDMD